MTTLKTKQVKFVYHNEDLSELESYFSENHIFPIEKYRLLYDRLISEKVLAPDNVISPLELSLDDLAIVHDKAYIKKLKIRSQFQKRFFWMGKENPISKENIRLQSIICDGSYKAAQLALAHRVGIHLGGGFHHAKKDSASGFCIFNDVSFAAKKLLLENIVSQVMVIDCDVHQGDGTAKIFEGDDSVYTFSIHQQDNFPHLKERSDCDVGLFSNEIVTDKLYLESLKFLSYLVNTKKPNIIFYIAGADPFIGDRLGGFKLSKEGLLARDKFVFKVSGKTPVVLVLGGGYSEDVSDVVDIHFNTVKEAVSHYKNGGLLSFLKI